MMVSATHDSEHGKQDSCRAFLFVWIQRANEYQPGGRRNGRRAQFTTAAISSLAGQRETENIHAVYVLHVCM
jgi:hypothetical protein